MRDVFVEKLIELVMEARNKDASTAERAALSRDRVRYELTADKLEDELVELAQGVAGSIIRNGFSRDQEDQAGRPFVGPAGQLLDRHLEKAGIDRGAAYVTNTVKHFKYVQRGKRRLHQSPTAKEIDTCRWWIESERATVRFERPVGSSRGFLGGADPRRGQDLRHLVPPQWPYL